jgi:hypothetical protein
MRESLEEASKAQQQYHEISLISLAKLGRKLSPLAARL